MGQIHRKWFEITATRASDEKVNLTVVLLLAMLLALLLVLALVVLLVLVALLLVVSMVNLAALR